jgi:outer membrane receptor for monomeric catechols
MKTSLKLGAITLLGLAFTLTTALGGEGGQSTLKSKSPKPAKTSSAKATKVEQVQVTGSRIPRRATLCNYTTDTDLTLTVIDRKQLDRMGAANVNEALKKTPMFR